MGERNWKDWRPFVYGGLASIVAELGNVFINDMQSDLKREIDLTYKLT